MELNCYLHQITWNRMVAEAMKISKLSSLVSYMKTNELGGQSIKVELIDAQYLLIFMAQGWVSTDDKQQQEQTKI